jgi:hypothetical protein
MKDQDVITRLVELHDCIQAPSTPAGEDAIRGKRLVRRRRASSVLAAVAAVVVAVGIVAVGIVQPDGQRGLQPAPAPSLPAPSDSAEASPDGDAVFVTELRRIVAQVPGWSITNTQRMFTNEPCAGNWSISAGGFGGGSVPVRTRGEPGQVWHEVMGFSSAADASDSVDRLVENLASCKTVAWQTQPIAQTGAVLASSADGLIWVQRNGEELSILEAATTDGPPPRDVQVEIADLMSSKSE